VFASENSMNSSWTHSLFCVLLASSWVAAAEAEASQPLATEASSTRLDGLLQGGPDTPDSSLASPSTVSLAAVKELSEASSQLKVWLEEVLFAVGALSVTSVAVLAFRRRKREREQRLRNLYDLTEMPTSLSERQTPRYLPSNPYVDTSTPELLCRQIENAAEASLEFGRVLGLIYFDLGERPEADFSDEARDWDADRLELMDRLKNALRRTDHVAALSDNEIVACIALLPGKPELASIAARLRKVGLNSPRFAKAFLPEAGLAMYPACGYRGEELIDYAKGNYRAHKPAAIAYQPAIAPALEGVVAPSRSA